MAGYRKINWNNIVGTTSDSDSVIIELDYGDNQFIHVPRIATSPPAYELQKTNQHDGRFQTRIYQDAYNLDIVYPDSAAQDAHLATLKTLFLEDLDFDKTGLATSANQVVVQNKLDDIEDNQTNGNQLTQVAARYLNMTQTLYTITTGDTIILPAGTKDYIQILHTGGRPVFIQFDATPTTASTRILNRTAITYDGTTPTNAIHASTVTTGTATLTVFTA